MLQKSMEIPYLTLEDVYTTGFLAQECDIPRLHHIGFRTVPMKFNYETNIINHLDYTNCFYYRMCALVIQKIKCYQGQKK